MPRSHYLRQRGILCRTISIVLGALLLGIAPDMGYARKELLTAEEKEQLRRAGRIHLDALALTTRGAVDPAPLTATVATRLEQLGYRVTDTAGQPADVTVKIKCEEVKTWEGPGLTGGDADMVDAAARVWKGPACQIAYLMGARRSDWRHEIRTDFASAQAAARQAGQADSGAYAIAALIEQLRRDDFPFLLAAEWEQPARLVAALDATGTTGPQKIVLIGLIGTMQAVDTIPRLTVALNDPDPAVAEAAATALGTIGHEDGIPALLSLFKSGTPEQRRAAAIGLGRLAPVHPNSEIVPTFLAALPREPVPIQIIMVSALGKTTDRRILGPLRALYRSVLKRAPEELSPELKELKTTLGIALDQFDDGTHVDE
jgi:hypothetical protein